MFGFKWDPQEFKRDRDNLANDSLAAACALLVTGTRCLRITADRIDTKMLEFAMRLKKQAEEQKAKDLKDAPPN